MRRSFFRLQKHMSDIPVVSLFSLLLAHRVPVSVVQKIHHVSSRLNVFFYVFISISKKKTTIQESEPIIAGKDTWSSSPHYE